MHFYVLYDISLFLKLHLSTVNRQLDIVKQAEAITLLEDTSVEVQPLQPTFLPAPNKKLDLQWRPNKFIPHKKVSDKTSKFPKKEYSGMYIYFLIRYSIFELSLGILDIIRLKYFSCILYE